MEEFSLDVIFNNNFGQYIKSSNKQNFKSRIHSKPDRNQSKLTMFTSSTREAHMLLFYATRWEQNLFKIVSYFFLRCFFSTFNLGSYKRLLDVGFNNFLGCHKSIKTLRQPEIEFGPIVFPSIAIGH